MKTEYSLFTNKGNRPVNEDSAGFVHKGNAWCFAVCDGLGGHQKGDAASSIAVEKIKEYFLSCSDIDSFARGVIGYVQNAVINEQKKLGLVDKMKTTAVILAFDGSRGISVHTGDSRLYQFRDNEVIFQTEDHSIPQILVRMGEMDKSEIRSHPDRNKLLRAIGDDREEIKHDIFCFEVRSGDSFLLCSDGFWVPVTEEDMTGLLKNSNSPEKWLKKMSELAVKNSSGKSMDNYTAIAVTVKG